MDKLLKLYSNHIDINKLRIRQFSGIILLCGGPTNHNDCGPLSARDFYLKRIEEKNPSLRKRIFLAESINTWAQDMIKDHYTTDLLTFESHVSRLASAVSLIVESPGSIAELGSFCLLKGVRERLMVVMRNEWLEDNSFISLGPVTYLRYLDEEDIKPIHSYPWRVQWNSELEIFLPNQNDLSNHADDFINDLEKFEENLPKRPKLKSDNSGHLSLLISDIINLYSALRIHEILTFMEDIGLPQVSRTDD